MADYSFLFADVLTNEIVEELPLDGVTFGRVLGGAGSFSASVLLDRELVRRLDPVAATIPNRRVVYVVRDGELLPPVYWVRTRRYVSAEETIEVAGSELWTYFAHRLIRETLTFEGIDQAAIVSTIIAAIQALPAGDVGLAVSAAATGVLRDRTYYGYELKEAAEAIEQLSEVIDGFDFAIDASGDLADPTKTLVVSYPQRGVQAFETDLLFDLPGNVLSYSWPEDGTRQANASFAIGGGEGDDMLLALATDADSLAAGYPLLERRESYKDIRDVDYLEPHAEADVAAAAFPVTIPELVVRGDVDPVVGSYDTGDECRLFFVDARFPEGLDVFARIVGYTVTPEDPDDGIERVDLDLGEAIA